MRFGATLLLVRRSLVRGGRGKKMASTSNIGQRAIDPALTTKLVATSGTPVERRANDQERLLLVKRVREFFTKTESYRLRKK
jgi:hypothetical protein